MGFEKMKKSGMGSHHSANMGKDEWLTPPAIIRSFGEFDLDPCSPIVRPWDTAKEHYTIKIDGLSMPWFGRVWMNPPYGKHTGAWLKKLSEHGNGIALIFARTETKMFFDWVWSRANAVFFLKGRLSFFHVDGRQAKDDAGAPSCLIAYGENNIKAIANSGIIGKLIILDPEKNFDEQYNF